MVGVLVRVMILLCSGSTQAPLLAVYVSFLAQGRIITAGGTSTCNVWVW